MGLFSRIETEYREYCTKIALSVQVSVSCSRNRGSGPVYTVDKSRNSCQSWDGLHRVVTTAAEIRKPMSEADTIACGHNWEIAASQSFLPDNICIR
ncbi:uncharacterized protein BO97DRAFT_237055 [Aspergillus homomorphus CBS 101889]|uniref:Uncharacterized protein n=1 Tax=Aspergillus homomorphus (strain CBS 101889) TaxID=1450537 RepID=A0A395I5J8_ASPHC|nr:hypothetical protein BO97DRAFT_237055 [Aspergillus homomorphus CBS 101889]RAL15046.1 hypothetical protein BO97DRAFT_237055 [Aspergillus homomorphus CBS 101889]